MFSHFSNYLAIQIPKQLSECPLKTNQSDKIFASTWLGADRIIAGTKDNKVLVWNLLSKQPNIPSAINLPRGENPLLKDHCGQHAIETNPSGSILGNKLNIIKCCEYRLIIIACGAQNEAEIAILSPVDFQPITVLSVWIFMNASLFI